MPRRSGDEEPVVVSEYMTKVMDWASRVGPLDSPVLLLGETGTGKEVVARAIHMHSGRSGNFVAVNCGAFPGGLFEAELFGHRRGAFTSATEDRKGLAEEAHDGSLFLDEIGELPASLQVALLRFLETGEIRKLGESRTRHTSARVIAATNRNLRREVSEGRFRSDLFYRLNVALCELPPLRHRLDDLDAFVNAWLPQIVQRVGCQPFELLPEARLCLREYSWPGNVRELRNVLERVALSGARPITATDIANAIASNVSQNVPSEIQTDNGGDLKRLLEQNHWRLGRTAAHLGINRCTLWRRLKKYNITP